MAATQTPARSSRRGSRLSAEVQYYLESRGYDDPGTAPAIRTPEPKVRGARFDPGRVDKAIDAMRLLPHTQGRWAGHPFEPDPWEVAYILAPVFGWVARDEEGRWCRVVRTLYVEVPRKNGKTSLGGRIVVALTFADGEPGAQGLTLAASKEQARFAFDPIRQITQQSAALKAAGIKPLRDRVVQRASGSYLTVVAAVGDLLYGANVHAALVDELHIHRSPDLLNTVETGTGSRTQPLVVIITTADDGRQDTIYDQRRRLIERLANRTVTDPSTYGVVWCADAGDDPFVEATWRKANPGYGVSVSQAYMRQKATRAQQSPADLSSFLRLHLGIRTKQETKYLELGPWDRNAGMVDAAALAGRECYGGLDLASTSDLCALAWVFPDDAGGYDVLWRHWCPERAFDRLVERTAGEARVWRRDGHLTVTDGDVADYTFIRAAINADRERFDVRQIAYDPWNADQLVNDLVADGAPMVRQRQGFVSMSGPTKELQRLLLAGTPEAPLLRHGGVGLLRWQVDNFAVDVDPAGNVKPSKKHAGDKIDGLVALINALDRAVNRPGKRTSAYEDNDLVVV